MILQVADMITRAQAEKNKMKKSILILITVATGFEMRSPTGNLLVGYAQFQRLIPTTAYCFPETFSIKKTHAVLKLVNEGDTEGTKK